MKKHYTNKPLLGVVSTMVLIKLILSFLWPFLNFDLFRNVMTGFSFQLSLFSFVMVICGGLEDPLLLVLLAFSVLLILLLLVSCIFLIINRRPAAFASVWLIIACLLDVALLLLLGYGLSAIPGILFNLTAVFLLILLRRSRPGFCTAYTSIDPSKI